MVFSTPIFLFAFLPIVLALYYLTPRGHHAARNFILLVFSLFFYAWGEPVHVLLMMLSILMNWGFGWMVSGRRGTPAGKGAVALAVVYNMGMLFVFKYLNFAADNLGVLLHTHFDLPIIALPIGISFYSFQALSYVIDVYRGHGEAQRNPMNVGLYIALFPQLIAGPIVRYETVALQIRERRENWDDFTSGVCRFIAGFAKKLILANQFGYLADTIFEWHADLSVGMAWLGALAYTFQIYFDFSGYSCMAIGLGRMFGFHFLENFDHPYVSRSITEFWRRWHISLGTWFRDYVYFPMGGSRVDTKRRLVFNLFIVWMLTGIWHGANWTFVAWGAMYFLLLTFEKLTGLDKRRHRFGHLYTLLFVVIGWVFFRSPTLADGAAYLRVMFGFTGAPLSSGMTAFFLRDYFWFFVAGAIFSLPVGPWLAARLPALRPHWNWLQPLAVSALFLIAVSFMIKSTYNPFIYFNF